jgi:peptidyl-prolyl cis-trans isomerase C
LKHTPPAQLRGLTEAGQPAPRAVVDQWLVPEMLSSLEAERRGLDKSPRVADRIREILRHALEKTVRSETLAADPVTALHVREYFDENRRKYEQPARIRIWRILVADEAAAKALVEEAKAENRPVKWSDLAREKSLDKATNQRQGDLGFVRQDGSTDVPRVLVNPELYKAAATVKDGEVVGKPVAEGDKFAVVWRRGSLAATKRPLEAEAGAIEKHLERQRTDKAIDALRDKLRAERLGGEHPELLEALPPSLFGSPPSGPSLRQVPAPSGSSGALLKQ